MRAFTDKEVLDRIRSLPTFTGFPNGVLDVWIRTTADAFDSFDDKAFTYECFGDAQEPKFIMARNGTTNAGSYGLKHFEEYNHTGCAVLKSDIIVYDSHRFGKHKGKDAYRQAKGFPYFRDANRNNRAEEIGPEHNDIILANVHRAGVNSTVINNWSTACLVTANLQKFLAFLNFMQAKGNPPLSVCILKEWPVDAPAVAATTTTPAAVTAGSPAPVTPQPGAAASAQTKTGVIVIDPGHGGSAEIDGSSANNARSASGVLEKNITLRIAFLVREELARIAAAQGHTLNVILTRETDINLGLAARAKVAKDSNADLFLCIHCNAFDGKVRGTETLISPVASGNTNHTADQAFAQMIQTAVLGAIRAHDTGAKDRKVKDQGLGVLKDTHLGTKARGCLVELEFIDVPAVDQLLNIGPQATQVRQDIAKALADALVAAL